jgi:hypothetical protein
MQFADCQSFLHRLISFAFYSLDGKLLFCPCLSFFVSFFVWSKCICCRLALPRFSPFPGFPLLTLGLMLSPFSIWAGVSAVPFPVPTSPSPESYRLPRCIAGCAGLDAAVLNAMA